MRYATLLIRYLGHIDVYKVHHHGSKYSSNLYFLRKIMPEFAMISVGDGNKFRHPTHGAINRLNDPGVRVERIFQTEEGRGAKRHRGQRPGRDHHRRRQL